MSCRLKSQDYSDCSANLRSRQLVWRKVFPSGLVRGFRKKQSATNTANAYQGAAACIAPLKAMGYRIPEDIALMGFGNDAVCQHTTPPLSSVHLPADKQVYTAIDLLLKILNKETPYEPGFHEIETELVIRESTEGSKL